MNETRYAILIGINDYKSQELHYCDNDVAKMREQLLTKCRVSEENLYSIVSSNHEHKNVDISLKDSINIIQKTFVPGEDSIIFYFSGHGKYIDRAYLEFHDELKALEDVYDLLLNLKPSKQIYIVDACYSGAEVQWKSSIQDDKFLEVLTQEKFISRAKGTYFLYSSTKDEKSKALAKYQGSVFTHYLIEGMIFSTGLYAPEIKTLSLSILFDYASRKMGLNSGDKQTPTMQKFEEGYYPFCFAEQERIISVVELKVSNVSPEDVHKFFYLEELHLPSDLRRDITQFVTELVLNLLEHGFSPNVELFCCKNTIEIRDYTPNGNNPLSFEKTEEGKGLKVYESFLNKYKSLIQHTFVKGQPNRVILEIDPDIFNDFDRNPCYFKTDAIPLFKTEYLNKYDFNDNCSTIVIDTTSSIIVVSYCYMVFDYLIKRTEYLQPAPLIVLRVNKNDMAREFMEELLADKTKYHRIMMTE